MSAIDPLELARRLIACPSVTPAEGGALDVIEAALRPIGFEVHRFTVGEAPDGPVENLFAMRGSGAPHFAFAGHSDVVPPGLGWASDPFEPVVRGQLLHGRGAVDMKGAIAAFIAAAERTSGHAGTMSLIITGDEEGPATYGTAALIEWMDAHKIRPDLCLVGEPTSAARLGDTIKIGRRGSVNLWIEVPGMQGHVAYPQLADNPIPRLVRILDALDRWTLDAGNAWFQPSNLEITDVDTGNAATNVIPTRAGARLNIRFNDLQQGRALVDHVRSIVEAHAPGATLRARISGEAFLTEPGAFVDLCSKAVRETLGREPELSTAGGISDARFIRTLCPVVELGLVGATMHAVDECVPTADIEALTAVYRRLIEDYFTAFATVS